VKAGAWIKPLFLIAALLCANRSVGAEPRVADQPISHWIARLQEQRIDVRRDASAKIASIRETYAKYPISLDSKDSLSSLVDGLSDSDTVVRANIAAALGWCQESRTDRNVIPALETCLTDASVSVRFQAALSLIDLSDVKSTSEAVLKVLCDVANDRNSKDQLLASQAIVRARFTLDDLTLLCKLVNHQNQPVRCVAIRSLATLGKDAQVAVPILLTRLTDPDDLVRAETNRALGAIGADPLKVVPQLIGALDDRYPGARLTAIEALASFGVDAKAAGPNLLELVKGPDDAIAAAAAMALGRVGADPEKAVPVLIDHLKNPTICPHAATALGSYGPAAKDAAPLLYMLASETIDKKMALSSLSEILAGIMCIEPNDERTSALVLSALRNPDRKVWMEAVKGCQAAGPAAKSAVPALAELVQRSDLSKGNQGFVYICAALEAIGPAAKPSIPALMDAYGRTDGRFHLRIRRTLTKIDPESVKRLAVPETPNE
jgi:HEAT repeat protein